MSTTTSRIRSPLTELSTINNATTSSSYDRYEKWREESSRVVVGPPSSSASPFRNRRLPPTPSSSSSPTPRYRHQQPSQALSRGAPPSPHPPTFISDGVTFEGVTTTSRRRSNSFGRRRSITFREREEEEEDGEEADSERSETGHSSSSTTPSSCYYSNETTTTQRRRQVSSTAIPSSSTTCTPTKLTHLPGPLSSSSSNETTRRQGRRHRSISPSSSPPPHHQHHRPSYLPPQSFTSSSSFSSSSYSSSSSPPLSQLVNNHYPSSPSHYQHQHHYSTIIPSCKAQKPTTIVTSQNRLPGSWTSSGSIVSLLAGDGDGGSRGEEAEQEEDEWTRQRRMSSLISGLGIVMTGGGVGVGTKLDAQEEEEEEEELGSEDGDGRGEGQGGVMSGSEECFESADEGEEGNWSPGRRVGTGGGKRMSVASSRRSSGIGEGGGGGMVGLATILDNSPELEKKREREKEGVDEREIGEVQVAFGYACDGLDDEEEEEEEEEGEGRSGSGSTRSTGTTTTTTSDSSPTSPIVDQEGGGGNSSRSPTSVKQLVRQSWKQVSKRGSKEFTLKDEERLSRRVVEQQRDGLGLSIELFDRSTTTMGTPPTLSRASSSYTPSPRPLLSGESSSSTTGGGGGGGSTTIATPNRIVLPITTEPPTFPFPNLLPTSPPLQSVEQVPTSTPTTPSTPPPLSQSTPSHPHHQSGVIPLPPPSLTSTAPTPIRPTPPRRRSSLMMINTTPTRQQRSSTPTSIPLGSPSTPPPSTPPRSNPLLQGSVTSTSPVVFSSSRSGSVEGAMMGLTAGTTTTTPPPRPAMSPNRPRLRTTTNPIVVAQAPQSLPAPTTTTTMTSSSSGTTNLKPTRRLSMLFNLGSKSRSPSTNDLHAMAEDQQSKSSTSKSTSTSPRMDSGGTRFHAGGGRRRSVTTDGNNIYRPTPINTTTTTPSPTTRQSSRPSLTPTSSSRTSSLLSPSLSPSASSSTPTFPTQPPTSPTPSTPISPSPFTSLRTFRSTLPLSTYDTLLQQYGSTEMKRQEVIWELCETEKSFVNGLRGVMEVFALPLRTEKGSWIKGVPTGVSRLLDWGSDIVYLHSQISEALQSARVTATTTTTSSHLILKIADSFLPFIPRLEVHQPYLVRFEAVTKAIDQMTMDPKSDFGEFVRMQSALPECGNLTLSSFLLKPVQRLMKYPLFFKQILDLTPPHHPDHISLLSLLHSTDSMIRVMQEVKTREDEYEEIKLLETRIRGLPDGFKLARRDRRLIVRGVLKRVHVGEKDRAALEMDALVRAGRRSSSSSMGGRNKVGGGASGGSGRMEVEEDLPPVLALSPDVGGGGEGGGGGRGSGTSTPGTESPWTVSSPTTPLSPFPPSSFPSSPYPTSPHLRPDSMISTSNSSSYTYNDNDSSTFSPSLSQQRSPKPSPSSSAFSNSMPTRRATRRVVKTKAKESTVHVFVFSDLIVLTTKSTDGSKDGSGGGGGSKFMRTPRSSSLGRRGGGGEATSFYRVVETVGLSRVLGVSDLSGKTEHEHLIEVDLLPMPTGDERFTSLTLNTSPSLPTSLYFTIPSPSSSASSSSSTSPRPDKLFLERVRWLQAFERSYLFALRSLSFPSLLNAYTTPITQGERLSCSSFVEVGIVPKSPSQQYLDRMGEGEEEGEKEKREEEGEEGKQTEREERAWWAVRLKKVRRELEGMELEDGGGLTTTTTTTTLARVTNQAMMSGGKKGGNGAVAMKGEQHLDLQVEMVGRRRSSSSSR